MAEFKRNTSARPKPRGLRGKSNSNRDSGRDRNSDRSDRPERRDFGNSGGRSSGGFSRREPNRLYGRTSERPERTKVTCSSCGTRCEVPFKPTSNKPVYCDECFGKQGKSSGGNAGSSKDLEIINDKLDKIMQALKIN
jgi:CxxC-x17-CxxC domain-containing protein